jgi:hypothetical protein
MSRVACIEIWQPANVVIGPDAQLDRIAEPLP